MELYVVTYAVYQQLEMTPKDDIIFVDNDILIYLWHSHSHSCSHSYFYTFTYISKFHSRRARATYYKDICYFEGAHNLTSEEAKVYLTFI